MLKLADDLWFLSFPLKILGVDIRRNVTIIRLTSGRLLIHSTASFSPEEIAQIKDLGEPGWLIEGMVDHDTYSRQGRDSFPEVPFLAPPGFAAKVDFPVEDLNQPPAEWDGQVEVIPIHGAPKMAESALFHRPSGTLIVCDLLFHFPEIASLWAKLLLLPTLGWDPTPGFSKRLKKSIEDEQAFRASLDRVMDRPICRIVPGHGVPLEERAKERADQTFRDAGVR